MEMAQHISDKRLEERINDRIRWDIRVSEADVLVKIHGGKVSLYGYFDKTFRHQAVVDIIVNMEGVAKFKDLSQVVSDYYRGDKEIDSLIAKQLANHHFLKGEWIEAKTADGVVKLEGEVYRSEMKAFASKCCWELSGVQDCINLIQLKDLREEKSYKNSNALLRKSVPAGLTLSNAGL
jgi:hyperosmotically inducible periplasmic protein